MHGAAPRAMKDHLSFLVKRSNTTGGTVELFRSAVYGLSGVVKLNVGQSVLVIWLQAGWLLPDVICSCQSNCGHCCGQLLSLKHKHPSLT